MKLSDHDYQKQQKKTYPKVCFCEQAELVHSLGGKCSRLTRMRPNIAVGPAECSVFHCVAFKGLELVFLAEKGGVAKWYYDNIMRNQSS